MSNRRLASITVCIAMGIGGYSADAADGNLQDLVNRKVLRVCMDPGNFPFSNRDEKKPGFENKIAEIVADELKIPIKYTWLPQVPGFLRKTLFAKRCDVVIGFAQGEELVLNTNHYYTSTYALVYPQGKGLDGVKDLADPKLKDKRVGVIAGSPPASLVARHGLMARAKPYKLVIDRRHESPSDDMFADLRAGKIDVGIDWGPVAGYYGKNGGDELTVVPLKKEKTGPRMSYRITMGVRQTDDKWKRELNEIIKKRQGDIDAVLLEYGVPILDNQGNQITEPRR